MQSKMGWKGVSDKVRTSLGKLDDLSFLYNSIDFSRFRDFGNKILYLDDFYLFPHQKMRSLDELNRWFLDVRSRINLPEYIVKGENLEFGLIDESRLRLARVWYEENVAIDRTVSRHTRQFFDPRLVPSDSVMVDGENKTVLLYDDSNDNPFGKDEFIKRRARLFFYPDEFIARKGFNDELNPGSFIELDYLKKS